MKKLLLLCVCAFVLLACNTESSKKDTALKFQEYIFNSTKGVVSKTSVVHVALAKDVTQVELGSELNSSFFEITPKVDGKVILKDLKTIVFTPSEYFKSDTKYKISLNLNALFIDVPKKLKKYSFEFKTIVPNFSINSNDLQSYDDSWQYINGELKSADVLSIDEVKTLLSANQEGKNLSVKWMGENSKGSTYFEFKIDSINRLKNDSQIALKWDGSKIDVADNSGSAIIEIPGKSNFSIISITARQFPEQHLRINFSDPLKKQQNLNGLVTIANLQNLKYLINGNVLKVYPESRVSGNLKVSIFPGILNKNSYKLQKEFSENVVFDQLKPSVQILTNGLILPDSKDLKFNFKSVNLKAVDVNVIKIYSNNILQLLQSENLNTNYSYAIKATGRSIAKKTIPLVKNDIENDGKWRNYAIDLSSLINIEPGAVYRVELAFRKEYSLFVCEGSTTTMDYSIPAVDQIQKDRENGIEESRWDSFNGYYADYDYDGDYSWRDRDNACTSSYFRNKQNIGGNVLATNLGALVKKGTDNTYFVATTNILTSNPEPNVNVELFNYQQHRLIQSKTNEEGIAILQSPSQAAFAIISKGTNKTYIKLKEGNSLSLSKFNVSGNKIRKGLKGYVYGERGVWRPGDTIHAVFVLNDNDNKLPVGHPVKMQVTDPHGKLHFSKVTTQGINGFYRFDIATSDGDATGNWSAKVNVGGATFYKNFKVETVKPNRLKIKLDFTEDILSVEKPIEGTIQVNWLHGAIAKNLKAEIKMKLRPTSVGFKKFPGYVFKDPIKKFSTEELLVFEGKVDEVGKARIHKKIGLSNSAPGLLKATFLTRVFENGGDFSSDVYSKNISPYSSFVGLKSPVSKRYGNSYITDAINSFGIATVNEKGDPVSRKKLEVKIYKIKWSWWWNSSSDNLASYVSREHSSLYKSFTISTDNSGVGALDIKIPNNRSGRYLIRITDPISGHSTGRTAYFFRDWWSNSSNKNSESATMLVFNSDKEKYNVGDVAQITFPSSELGNALVSVENSSKVISTQWVKTGKGQTVASIPITAEMTPNVFVNISLLQPHAMMENDLPLRLYGVIPIMVEDEMTRLRPQISMPKELRPEETFNVKISEKEGKRMTYTLAVVEEGLLDLTRFKTPDLWNVFYSREALGVKTWDVFDDVIGAFGGSINQIFSIGGDEDSGSKKSTKANRFKSVSKVLGPFTLTAGETATHAIKLPNYIGSVRTMVVAGDNSHEAYGSADESTPVRKPLMVLASLPRKLSPGEKVILPVTVFVMDKKVKDVEVRLKLSDGISIIGAKSQILKFDKPDEKMAYFELDVSNAQGVNEVEVLVSGNGEKASQKVEIDVVNPNPMTSKFIDLELKKNDKLTANFKAFGDLGTNTSELEISSLPPMNFSKRLNDLIRYPHGCVEQTTSSVFPQLYLSSIFDLEPEKQRNIKSNIEKAIKRLGKFQLANGGLTYWIGYGNANDWGTSYAGHFMIEAEKKGFALPLTFLNSWLKYQKQTAREWRPSFNRTNSDLAQAYRLYTLALAGYPDLGAMNRLREYKNISNTSKWRLAAAYALAGHNEAAQYLVNAATLDFGLSKVDYYTYGSSDRNRAMAMETLLLLKDERSRDLAKIIAKRLSSNDWMSTQTTAYNLLSMAKMVEINGGKNIDVTYSINSETKSVSTKNTIATRVLEINERGENQFSITNNKDNVLYVRIINSGILPVGSEIASQRNLNLYVNYLDGEGNKIPVSSLSQGTDFVAEVTISNGNKEDVNDIALTQIFPSGWEIVNTRFTDFGDNVQNNADFTDIRDDRVNFYFSLKKNEVKKFKVLLNASYLGDYYLPGVQAEAMYDNEYFSRTTGRWIKVIK